jgi:hypothetical protein
LWFGDERSLRYSSTIIIGARRNLALQGFFMIETLAPHDLINYRSDRFDGGGFSVALSDLAAVDASFVMQVYQATLQLNDLWLYMKEAPNYDLLWEQVKHFGSRDFLATARPLAARPIRWATRRKSSVRRCMMCAAAR